jgi:hypothetical protein
LPPKKNHFLLDFNNLQCSSSERLKNLGFPADKNKSRDVLEGSAALNNLFHFKRSGTTRAGLRTTVEISVGAIFGWLLIVVVLAVAGKVPPPTDLPDIISLFRSLRP